jgi:hypothetical protein
MRCDECGCDLLLLAPDLGLPLLAHLTSKVWRMYREKCAALWQKIVLHSMKYIFCSNLSHCCCAACAVLRL